MARCRCIGMLFILVVLPLTWNSWGQAQPAPDVQSSVQEAAQATAIAHFDHVPPERYLADKPPVLSPEEVKRLQEALKHTHRPGPPLSVEPGIRSEALVPTSPPTALPWPAELLPRLEAVQDFTFFRNQDLAGGAPSSFTSVTNEPSVANSGTVVFQTGNWYAASSTDGGQTFTFVNPFTGPFSSPAPSPDFCCDQVVLYVPSANAIFWLQQYIQTPAGNVHRINVDQGANGTWDCHYDFTPQGMLGAPRGYWFDFPDLVLGSNSLYHTTNVFDQSEHFQQAVIARYPLSQMATCQPTINFDFFSTRTSFSFRATHGAGTTMYWGAHDPTSALRIFRWAEGSTSIFSDSRSVSPWVDGGGTCPGPDHKDWCGRSDGRIQGAYVAHGVIGFLWNSAQGGGFPYPHVRFARFQESDRSLMSQGQIWNSQFALLYPSVDVNGRGHIGGTILTGGGISFPACHAWIADDINGGALQPLETRNVVTGTSGPNENALGDYLTARPHATFPNTWIGTCFSLQGGGDNSHARPRFIWFGRARDNPITLLQTLTVTLTGSGSGTVTSSPDGSSCPPTCSAALPQGQSVTLTARAAAGSNFVGWSGEGCSGTGTCTVSMTQDRNVTVTFDLSSIPAPPNPADIPAPHHLTDVNGDGRADLVWRYTPTGQVAVWFLNGPTLLGGSLVGPAVDRAWQIVGVGDLNGDGKADLVWRHTTTGQVAVWLLNGPTLIGTALVSSPISLDWQLR